MKSAVILCTALVPTIGHKALIDFASNLVGPEGNVQVIISARTFEPVLGKDRLSAFEEHYGSNHFNIEFSLHEDDNAPQNPQTPEEWKYWETVCRSLGGHCPPVFNYDYFVASEPYGKKMAEILECEFIPFDMDRTILSVKGSVVRQSILSYFNLILPEFKKRLISKFTIFGQESTGKTTITRKIGDNFYTPISATHEFARPYLEMMDDRTVTDHKMDVIAQGQYALQLTAYNSSQSPAIIQDTDLLSTIGYGRIYGIKWTFDIDKMFQETKSDLYFVMPDDIPFAPDPLRYGGDVRESTKQFWIDLLEEYECAYKIVGATDPKYQIFEIKNEMANLILNKFRAIKDFERE